MDTRRPTKLHSAKGLALGLQPCVEQSEQEQEQEQEQEPATDIVEQELNKY